MQILINRDGQQLGPYTLEQVNEYLAAGSLSPNDPAWHEGLAEWVALNEVRGIIVPAASTPPPFDPGAFSASPPPSATPSPPPAEPAPPVAEPPMAMGTVCPQCNAGVQPDQVVCMNCGSPLHALPSAGKKGAGKLIAIIGGGVLALGVVAVVIIYVAVLAPRKKAKDNRVKCVNNTVQQYKAMLAFAQDNGERMPWQLTPSGVRNHIANNAAPGTIFGMQGNAGNNEVVAHNNVLQTAGVWGLAAVKRELQTPKILLSPCDPTRAAQNELVQENWTSYNTKASGVSAELGGGGSYTFIRGADTMRPSSVLLVTRNWSGNSLDGGSWVGSDSDSGRTMDGLNKSQGQVVQMDGSARQASNADLGGAGTITRSSRMATGGVARGKTSLNILRGAGL